MLHKVSLPGCTTHLRWIVQFQGDLLRALCKPGVAPADVTAQWVPACRPDIDAVWMARFCAWSSEGQSVLARLQGVAALSAASKNRILGHYETNLRYPEAFGNAVPPPPPTQALPGGLSDPEVAAYRNFFQLFYAPIFYPAKGYPIVAPDLKGTRFTRDVYLAAYRTVNPGVLVCPLCDGSLDGSELDHWLAQKHLPELNCHPDNLFEICGACNRRPKKGEKLTLDEGHGDPFGHWFHPHLRPAVGQFFIRVEQGEPLLASDDPAVQERLDRLSQLVNLPTRWKTQWSRHIRALQERIRGRRREGRRFDEDGLRRQLREWRSDAESELGITGHKLLETRVLAAALVEGSDVFQELWEYAAE